MADEVQIEDAEKRRESHPGGGRFNRLLGVTFVVVMMAGGLALALGIQSSGKSQDAAVQKALDDPGAAARERGEVEDLAANGGHPHSTPYSAPTPPVLTTLHGSRQRANSGAGAMKSGVNFSAAWAARGRADRKAGEEWGEGRSFVEQDKATAARYGIFGPFLNERAVFSPRSGS